MTGTVSADTRVSCENEREHGAEQRENHRRHGHGGPARASREGESGGRDEGTGNDPAGAESDPMNQDDPANAQDDPADDDAGQPGHDGEGEQRCSAADLKAGTAVHEASTELPSTDLVFHEVELVK